MAHHTMIAMVQGTPIQTGIDQSGVEEKIRKISPGFLPLMRYGMAEQQEHTGGRNQGPANKTAIMVGKGLFGIMEMGGIVTVVKIRV